MSSLPSAPYPGDPTAAELGSAASVSVPGRALGRALGFLNQLILARLLGAGAFGLYSIGWSLLRAANLLAPIGMDAAILRFGAVHWPEQRQQIRPLLLRALLIGLFSGTAFGAVIFLGSDLLAEAVFHKPALATALRYVAVCIPVAVMLRILASATTLTRTQQYAVLAEEISQPVLQLGLVLLLLRALVPGLDAAMAAVLLSVLLAGGLASAIAWRLFGQVAAAASATPAPVGAWLSFSIPVAIGGFMGSFLLWADRVLVGALATEAEAGVYAVASLASLVFVTLLSGIKSSYAPIAAALHVTGDRARLGQSFRLSTRWSQYLSVPVFLFLAFSGRDMLVVGLGPEYAAGYVPMLVLSAAQLVNASTGPGDTLLIMSGNPKRWTALAGLGMTALIVLALAWIPRWGLLGAAMASAVTVMLVSIGSLVMVYRSLRINPYDARSLRVLASAAITLGVLLGLGQVALPGAPLRIAANGVISVGVFFGLLALGGLPPEEADVLRRLWNWGRRGVAKALRAR